MKKGTRASVYDEGLKLEAYRLEGIAQPFPAHFHEYYVIGLIESGTRILACKSQEYSLHPGDLLLLNPGDSHACAQSAGEELDYRGFNIAKPVMLGLAEEITGRREPLGFSVNTVSDEEAACYLRQLHEAIMERSDVLDKEENFLLLLGRLIQQYSRPFEQCLPECREEIERACAFMEAHYAGRVTLDQICHCAGLSRSALLRAFARAKGVTPYRYLENIRISKARRMLEQGIPPVEAALRTGFSDQSHLTNCFHRFIGLTPGTYQEIFSKRKECQNG